MDHSELCSTLHRMGIDYNGKTDEEMQTIIDTKELEKIKEEIKTENDDNKE